MDRIDAMRGFVAIADQRGFAPAARALGLSPPALTRSIAALEQSLGVKLLHRSTRAVSLTDEGAAFLERARRVLSEFRDAELAAIGGRAAPQGRLYVTAPTMFGRLHVLPVMVGLLDTYPGLSARMMLSDRNVRLVEEGIDISVRIGPLIDSGLRAIPVGSVRRVAVASPSYLAAHRVGSGGPHHMIDGALGRVDEVLPSSEQPVSPRLTVNTVDCVIAAAEAGLGLAVVLSYQVADALAAGRLAVVGEPHPVPLPVTLLFDAGRAGVPSVRAFIRAVQDRAANGGWQ